MKTESLHKLVGACVVGITLAFSLYWLGRDVETAVDDSYYLSGTFSKVDGVSVGSQVLLAGIPIGKVVSEKLDPVSHQVTLNMQISNRIEIPLDSVAQITSDGIFGGKYISVDVGGEYDMLENGDAFEYIRDSIIFENVFKKIIEMGETGLAKRKADALASDAFDSIAPKKTNPFATDPSLLFDEVDGGGSDLGSDLGGDPLDDPFEEDIEDNLKDTKPQLDVISEPQGSEEGAGPV